MEGFKQEKHPTEGKGENDEIDWITVKGTHIPIKDGQSKQQTIQNYFKKSTNNKSSLERDVDKILKGTYKGSHIVILKETPKILQDVGMENKPFLMTARHTYLAINQNGKYDKNEHYHNLGKSLFLSIPKLFERPMLVLQSKNSPNDILSLLSWYDHDKNILICPIRLNGNGKYNEVSIQGHIIKSIYGKANIKNYINKNFKQEDIVLVENKKIRDLYK